VVALAIIIVNVLLLIIFGPDARSVQTSYAYDSFQIGAVIVDASKAYAAAAAIVFTAGLFAFFRYSLLGKAIRACADNYTGALVVGLNVKHLYALTFAIGTACVGAAGTMMTLITDVTPAARSKIHTAGLRHCHYRRAWLDARCASRRRVDRR
jgi:branched-chain amino acid transport system permease protein